MIWHHIYLYNIIYAIDTQHTYNIHTAYIQHTYSIHTVIYI